MARGKEKSKKDVYQIITDRILEKLEQGIIPWSRPWGVAGAPKNLVSGREYSGINTFLLGSAQKTSAYWLTSKQIFARGGKINQSAESEIIVFWKDLRRRDDAGEELEESEDKPRFVLRYYRVFSLDDVAGIEAKEERLNQIEFTPLETCARVVAGYTGAPEIEHGGPRAYYSKTKDMIKIPEKETFRSFNDYYTVLFHELAHSTGATHRLNREGFEAGDMVHKDSKEYSKEELIAEISASFLCAVAGVENDFDNSVAYLQGWSRRFREKPKMIIQAAAAAQKATDYILGS